MHFQFDSFRQLPLRHAMSLRRPELPSEGDIAYARDTNWDHVRENREAFLRSAGFDPAALTLGLQVHGDGVTAVTATDRGRGQPPDFDSIPNSDGLATISPELALGSIVADCVPILLYDPDRHALAVVHAGWRGTVKGIAARAIELMGCEYGSDPGTIIAGIGPSIGPCCYEVGDEVIAAWSGSDVPDWKVARIQRSPRPHFDLWEANRRILLQAGIQTDKIEVAQLCTRCAGEHFFSHRAALASERPRGRMIMVAQLT